MDRRREQDVKKIFLGEFCWIGSNYLLTDDDDDDDDDDADTDSCRATHSPQHHRMFIFLFC